MKKRASELLLFVRIKTATSVCSNSYSNSRN